MPDLHSGTTLGLVLPMEAAWTLAAWESHIPWWQVMARLFQGQPQGRAMCLVLGTELRADVIETESQKSCITLRLFVVNATVKLLCFGKPGVYTVVFSGRFTSWFAQPAP